MRYFTELPEVSSIGVDGDIIELELDQALTPRLGNTSAPVVLVARHGGQIVVAVGKVIELANRDGSPPWCRVKIEGSSVTFAI